MKIPSTIAIAIIVVASFSATSIAQRQTKLYIDDGNGNFTTLQTSSGGGTLTLPSGSGFLSLGAGGVTLQGTPPLVQETGSINLSGDIIGGSSLTTEGTITASNIGGGNLIIDPTGAGSGNLLQFNASGGTTEDIYGTGGHWDVTPTGLGTFSSINTLNVNTFSLYTLLNIEQSGNYTLNVPNDPTFTLLEEGGNGSFVHLVSPVQGRVIAIKFRDANSAHSMTVSAFPNLIDGNTTYTLNGYGGAHPSGITLVCDGTDWYIIGSH